MTFMYFFAISFSKEETVNFKQFMRVLARFRPTKTNVNKNKLNTREEKLKCKLNIGEFTLILEINSKKIRLNENTFDVRHCKSPRSRRNLVVIDPLTPSQGHQFDCRLNFSVYPGILPIPFNLICHITMFRNLIFDPSPRPQGAGTQNMVSVHVPFM